MSVTIDADALRRELARRGLTAADFARLSRVSPATLSHALCGRSLSVSTVRCFARALTSAPVLDGADAILAVPGRLARRRSDRQESSPSQEGLAATDGYLTPARYLETLAVPSK
jgi:transcriptional regulator with XRE-family HTH domain